MRKTRWDIRNYDKEGKLHWFDYHCSQEIHGGSCAYVVFFTLSHRGERYRGLKPFASPFDLRIFVVKTDYRSPIKRIYDEINTKLTKTQSPHIRSFSGY